MTTNPKADDKRLFDSLKARCRWPWIRRFLKDNDLKPGIGWADVERLAASGTKDGADLITKLTDVYVDLVISGNKYVQVYELDDELAKSLAPIGSHGTVSDSAFTSSYPYVLRPGDLKGAPSEKTLCEVRHLSNGDFCLVYCSRRDYVERQLFEGPAAEAIVKASKVLSGFDQVIALRTQSFQAYDVVTIRPKAKRIELMVDLPLAHAQDLQRETQASLLLVSASLSLPALQKLVQSQAPDNLADAIMEIYRNKTAGKLQGLRFRTSDGLLDFLRTTIDTDDLRINKYHANGASAINNEIDPFEVTTRFDLTMPAGHAIVRLAGRLRSGATSTDVLYGMDVTECLNHRDLSRAIGKVVSYL